MRRERAGGFSGRSARCAPRCRWRKRDTPCYHRRRFRFAALSTADDVTTRIPGARILASMAVVSSLMRRRPRRTQAFAQPARSCRRCRRLASRAARRRLRADRHGAGLRRRTRDTVTLNFVNADIDAVVKAVGEITGRNFLVDPRVKGTVNIVSARPVPKALVYPTLLSALRMQGFAAVEGDGVVEDRPRSRSEDAGRARCSAAPSRASGDRIVTQVIPLRYESAAQLVTVLRPLISPNNTIAAYIPNNAIIITDYADNLKRIDRIIASLDQPPAGEPMLVPVKNASALDVVAIVNRLLTENAGQPGAQPSNAQQRVALVADPRSNSILIRADNPARGARVRQLIEQLDTPARTGGNVFIVYLKNAEAAQVAETLRGAVRRRARHAAGHAGARRATGDAGGASPAAATTTTELPASARGDEPLATSAHGAARRLRGRRRDDPGRRREQRADHHGARARLQQPARGDRQARHAPRAGVRRGADRRGVVRQGRRVRHPVAGADGRGRATQRRAGLRRHQLRRARQRQQHHRCVGQPRHRSDRASNLGIISGTINIPGLGIISNLGLLVRALENDIEANILSTPTLLTLDNEEARIIVGQNVPFITGQYAPTGRRRRCSRSRRSSAATSASCCACKPQITEGGTVRLGIYQEVSRVRGQFVGRADPVQARARIDGGRRRPADRRAGRPDPGQPSTTAREKVPYAGDVPVFGSLFRYDNAVAREDQPDDVPQADDRARHERRTRAHARALRLPARRAANAAPETRWFWKDPTTPAVAAAGHDARHAAGRAPQSPAPSR